MNLDLDLQHPRTKTYKDLERGNYTVKNNGPDDVAVSVGDGKPVIVKAGDSVTVGVPRGGSVTLALTEEGEGASGTFTKD